MTTIRNFQGPNPKYRTASDGGGPYSKTAQTNFDGGKVTKNGGGKSKRQMNFDVSASIPVKFENGPGKAGTGSQGGF